MSKLRPIRLSGRAFVAVTASLMLIAFSLPACAPQGPTPEEQTAQAGAEEEADREAIDRMREEFVAAFNAGDIVAMMGFYTENPVVLSPDGPPAEGLAAVRAMFEELYAQGSPSLVLSSHGIEVHGDIAFDRGDYELTMTPAAAPEAEPTEGKAETEKVQATPVTETGDWVVVLKRTEDGAWKVHWDIWNIDRATGGQPTDG